MIYPTQVEKAYLGRPGCMCGCLGNYAYSGTALTRRLNRMNKLIAEGKASYEDNYVYYTDDKTNIVIYLNKNA